MFKDITFTYNYKPQCPYMTASICIEEINTLKYRGLKFAWEIVITSVKSSSVMLGLYFRF